MGWMVSSIVMRDLCGEDDVRWLGHPLTNSLWKDLPVREGRIQAFIKYLGLERIEAFLETFGN